MIPKEPGPGLIRAGCEFWGSCPKLERDDPSKRGHPAPGCIPQSDPIQVCRSSPAAHGAIIVNPNDKVEVAEAIRDALAMSQQERVSRWQSMIGPLRDRDVSWWAAAFLKELAAAERMQGDRFGPALIPDLN